jgi:hypothetical protein
MESRAAACWECTDRLIRIRIRKVVRHFINNIQDNKLP